MIKFAQIDIENGEVLNIVNLQSAHGYTDGAIRDGILFKRLEPGTDEQDFAATNYWKDGAFKTREKCPGPFYLWKNEAWAVDLTGFWEGIRNRRNQLLSNTDWTQVPDCPLSETRKEEWRVYRQKLRDVITTNADVTKPQDFVWPLPPSL